jgi:hypothetical protein
MDAPGAFYHIMIPGIERRKIFQDDQGRRHFSDRLGGILMPGKDRRRVEARSLFCYWAAKLGVFQPTVSISVRRGQKLARTKALSLPLE